MAATNIHSRQVPMNMQPDTPPGWYPDPWGGEPMRYWDGMAWTSHTYGALEASANESTAPVGQRSATLGRAGVLCWGIAQPISGITAIAAGYAVYAHKSDGFFSRATTPAPGWYAPFILLSFLAGLSLLAAFVLFIIWSFRVAKNGRALGYPASLSPGWAIGGWFIPIANLFLPYLSIRGGAPADTQALVLRWWLAYVGASLLGTGLSLTNFIVAESGSTSPLIASFALLAVMTALSALQIVWGLSLARKLEAAHLANQTYLEA